MSDIKSMICHHKQDRECQKGVKMKQGVANSLLFCLEGLMVAKEIRNKKLASSRSRQNCSIKLFEPTSH